MDVGLKYLFPLFGFSYITCGIYALNVYSGDDSFSIRHADTGSCLRGTGLRVGVAACTGSLAERWKWGSGHRLFHVATARCLGVELGSKTLALLSCDFAGDTLWWRCSGGLLYTAYQMSLTVINDTAAAKKGSQDQWMRDDSVESICQRHYQILHTTMGNSFGTPCDFPFLYNGSWHYGCLPHSEGEGLSWCSTTGDYDTDRKWGNCLTPEPSCKVLWENPGSGICYQYNLESALSWHEARTSCRSQGGDLLSISSGEELISVLAKGSFPEQMWIGLNQLDASQGWQWSDSSPLIFIKWDKGMPFTSVLRESDCAVMNSQGFWESKACGKRLPYICEKTLNRTLPEPATPLVDKTTSCEDGWTPWDGFCYKLVKVEPQTMREAQQYCQESGANLLSLHSLAEVEALSTNLHSDDVFEVWTGLRTEGNQQVFNWVDKSPVSFTYWSRNEPRTSNASMPACVSYIEASHLWKVTLCDSKLPFVCKKKGEVKEFTGKAGCPEDGEWKRHGNACYRVDTKAVLFKDRCDLTIMTRFEQIFINALVKEYVTLESKYFWTGLQDVNNTGEFQWIFKDGHSKDVTYTNWNSFEPALAGGCVLMSTKPLGKWEVKDCNLFKAGSMCKMDIKPEEEPAPDLSLPCPQGWTSRSHLPYCYKVFDEARLSRKRTWEEAELFCQALGAHLASFSHLDEMRSLNAILKDSISRSDDRYFWFGLNRRSATSENSWQWSDGRPVVIFSKELQEDDEYNRNCAAFKIRRRRFSPYFWHPVYPFWEEPSHFELFQCDAQLEWICQIPRGKKERIPEWYNPSGHHETSIFVDGREFWFVADVNLTYEEAGEYCWSEGSKLAGPMRYSIIKQIQEKIAQIPQRSQESWWVDLKNANYLYPFRFTHHNFLDFYGGCRALNQYRIQGNFKDCEDRHPFVCERLNTTSVEKNPPEPHPTGLPCDNGYLAFGDKCYMAIKPRYLSFQRASEYCNSLKGTLPVISSQAEQDFIMSLLPDQPVKFWIGLRIWRDASLEWIDKSTLTFVNMNPMLDGYYIHQSPNTQNAMGLCFYAINDPHPQMMGTWVYAPCTDYQYVTICQHYADKPESPRIPTGEFMVGDHTYRILQRNVTWFEALEQCKAWNMDLASVVDPFQQASLTVTVSRANTSLWLGLYSVEDGVNYRWTDHSYVTFSRWSPEAMTSGHCVYLDTDGFWRALACDAVLPGALCHIPHAVITPDPEKILTKCPHVNNGPNWIPFRNNCYAFLLESFQRRDLNRDVREICRKLDRNSNILTIRDEKENEFVKKQLLPFKDLAQFVWLGVFKDTNDNRMKWYDGTNVLYQNWLDGRPEWTESFQAGLNLNGIWEVVTEVSDYSLFRQRSIMACKIDNDPIEDFKKSTDLRIYGNLSYFIIQKKLSWFEALRECQTGGGHLASIHDSAHDAHLEQISKLDGFPLWIGLSSQEVSGNKVYEWSDGSEYDYQPFGFSTLDNENGSCALVNTSGSWIRRDCLSKQDGAICYNNTFKTETHSQTLSVSRKCPQGSDKWIEFREHCYAFDMTFYNYSVYTMDDAKSICQHLDASSQLLTIKDREENDFVSKYLTENPIMTGRVWLGMNVDPQGEPLSWVDGSNLQFSNWEKPTDIHIHSTGACAVLLAGKEGTWRRVGCRDTRSRIVCKMPIRSERTQVFLAFFFIIFVTLVTALLIVLYRRNRSRFVSTIRYQRDFDAADCASIITERE